MFKVEDNTIHCTRGDKGKIEFSCKNNDGTDYIFQDNEKVILKVFDKKDVTKIVLKKEVNAEKGSKSVEIDLDSEDTKIGDYINKSVIYNYEISINDTNTVICYDEDGAKEFILYPEGGE